MNFRLQCVRFGAPLLAAFCLLSSAACHRGGKSKLPVAGSVDADKFLFDRGSDALARKHWIEAREYFRRLVDTYPGSQYRSRAKLGLGDAYLGENTVESRIIAINEFREFLSYFPGNERADYAQFRIATGLFNQMLSPQRDQTATKDALKEFDKFLENYPSSPLKPDVQKMRRAVRDRLSDAEYLVGHFYMKNRWCPGAIERMRVLLSDDPGYSRRDAAYFDMGECLVKLNFKQDAVPLFQKIVDEFPKSKFRKDAAKRVAQLKR